MTHRETHTVEIAGLTRHLPLFQVAPGVKIAILNMLGDTEVIQASATALTRRLPANAQVLLTAEAKSIPLAHAMSVAAHLPYVVLRKSYKPYMGETIRAETLSITTGQRQTLYLDEKDIARIKGQQVVIVDDVISTGSTLQGMRLIIAQAGGAIAATMAVFTEGEHADWQDIIALGHLPVFASE